MIDAIVTVGVCIAVSFLTGIGFCAIAHFGGASRRPPWHRPDPGCLCKQRVCTYDPDFGCGSGRGVA